MYECIPHFYPRWFIYLFSRLMGMSRKKNDFRLVSTFLIILITFNRVHLCIVNIKRLGFSNKSGFGIPIRVSHPKIPQKLRSALKRQRKRFWNWKLSIFSQFSSSFVQKRHIVTRWFLEDRVESLKKKKKLSAHRNPSPVPNCDAFVIVILCRFSACTRAEAERVNAQCNHNLSELLFIVFFFFLRRSEAQRTCIHRILVASDKSHIHDIVQCTISNSNISII
jgi:hypothetical protein